MGSPQGPSSARVAVGVLACQDAEVITDIIAIDPGLASGVAHVAVTPERFSIVSTAELNPRETGLWLRAALRVVPDVETTAVVIERFTITQKTAQNSQAPWSLEIIGQSRWIVWEEISPERELIVQSVADSKAAFKNDRLREMGLWHRGGHGHAVEALRHVALFAHRARILPARQY
jgi:hypothetical protein